MLPPRFEGQSHREGVSDLGLSACLSGESTATCAALAGVLPLPWATDRASGGELDVNAVDAAP